MKAMQTPGKNTDLTDSQLAMWGKRVQEIFDGSIKAAKLSGRLPWFVNVVSHTEDPLPQEKDIDWTAFPKRRPGLYEAVDANREFQDEYCEWSVAGPPEAITSVTFTTETPDYFVFLHDEAPDVLESLYHKYVSPQVQLADLQSNGRYDPQNDWNTGVRAPGKLMHMAQSNNFLSAASTLSAIASWPAVAPPPGSQPIVSEQDLIGCLGFGVSSRHSDPHIGAQVNEVVRGGHKVSLGDPVGLYIHRILLDDFETPDGSPITDWLEYDDDRGVEGFRTRVTFRPPEDGGGLSLSGLTVGGDPLRSGGQIAERIRVRIRGVAFPPDDAPLDPLVCDGSAFDIPAGAFAEDRPYMRTRL